MYGGIVDAFKSLVSGEARSSEEISSSGSTYRITRLSEEGTYLCNGLEYCFVEVTFGDGVQYGIDAYGDEALALRREALGVVSGLVPRQTLMVAPVAH